MHVSGINSILLARNVILMVSHNMNIYITIHILIIYMFIFNRGKC